MKRHLAAIAIGAMAFTSAMAEAPAPINGQRSTLFELVTPDSTSIVFLGNSLTNGCEWHELLGLPNVLNRGISGDTTGDIARRLHTVTDHKPAKIFLLTGANDVSHDLSADSIAADILALVDRIRTETPDTKLYLQSLLPINNSYSRYKRMIGKEQVIVDTNRIIAEGAALRGIPFINLYPLFCDSEGNLRADLTNDGLHLLGPAYLIWKEAVMPYLQE